MSALPHPPRGYASVGESAQMAVDTLRSHKLRSILTIVGIVIGVASIVGMTSLVRGLDERIVGELREIGSDHLFLRKWAGRFVAFGSREFARLERRPDITVEDARAIGRLPSVETYDLMLGAAFPVTKTIAYRGEETRQDVIGVTERHPVVYAADIESGRFFTDAEVRARNRVVVLGPGVVELLFPHVDPLGKAVRIGGLRYTVIGVFEDQPLLISGQSKDNRVVTPWTAFALDFEPNDPPDIMLTIVPTDEAGVTGTRDDLTFLLRQRHRLRPGQENDFDIVTQSSFLELWDQITGAVFLAMIVISSIALMVGGIGVMNIMLVSVTERTREIGVRKALGARRRDILWQFLVEAVVLTGIGGILGVVIGSGLGATVSRLIDFPVSLPAWSFVLGVGFSAAIGIFFGIYPAHKASRLDPIEALRYE